MKTITSRLVRRQEVLSMRAIPTELQEFADFEIDERLADLILDTYPTYLREFGDSKWAVIEDPDYGDEIPPLLYDIKTGRLWRMNVWDLDDLPEVLMPPVPTIEQERADRRF